MKKVKLLLIPLLVVTIVIFSINDYVYKCCAKKLLLVNDEKPIALFGIIADVQYADIEDQMVYGRQRYYRSSVDLVSKAVTAWKSLELIYDTKFQFILQLGDICDIRGNKSEYDNNVLKILNVLNTLFPGSNLINSDKILHILGNHETAAFVNKEFNSNFSKMIMNTAKTLNNDSKTLANYYFADVSNKLRMICLDLYEVSLYDTSTYEFKRNYNDLVKLRNNSMQNKFSKFSSYNGAISQTQFEWLRKQLEISQLLGKQVIIAGHIPLLTNVGDVNIAWNSEQILDLIRSYDSLVIAYIAGHFHQGGYYLDKYNIHHLTVSSILEASSNSIHRFVTGLVYDDRLVIQSQFKNRSFTVYFK